MRTWVVVPGAQGGRFPVALLVVLLAAALMASACTAGDSGRPPDPARSEGVDADGPVDPQVLDDVAVSAFPAPGRSVRQLMRVSNFVGDFIATACGSTERLPADRTWERYEQEEFPDLELIRAKGFSETSPIENRQGPPPGYRPGCDARSEGNLFDRLPSHQPWLKLRAPWDDVVATVEQEASVATLKAPFAQCLRRGSRGTGIVVSSEEPARSFLPQLGKAQARGTLTNDEVEHRMATLYATCGRAYFARTQALLEAERPAMIERHRELLEKFARELVAIGYVP